jgi:hypothetical protein
VCCDAPPGAVGQPTCPVDRGCQLQWDGTGCRRTELCEEQARAAAASNKQLQETLCKALKGIMYVVGPTQTEMSWYCPTGQNCTLGRFSRVPIYAAVGAIGYRLVTKHPTTRGTAIAAGVGAGAAALLLVGVLYGGMLCMGSP